MAKTSQAFFILNTKVTWVFRKKVFLLGTGIDLICNLFYLVLSQQKVKTLNLK